ncbi:MAG: hypothetical protein KAJ58_01390 [Candidatus Pacebacteria bacterium]|nr:hypothetical protein [Candidatus Paceibacterota bacterium]
MIKNKLKIFGITGLLIIGIFSFNITIASVSSLYVSPVTLNKKIGDSFVMAVSINPNGSKVCAVEGNLELDKLSCENIILEEGLMAQKMPSCSDATFLIGFPNCTTENKILFTIKAHGNELGLVDINLVDADIIGMGLSLPFITTGASYNFSLEEPFENFDDAIQQASACNCGEWGEWYGDIQIDCGQGGCELGQLLQTRERECSPISCDTEVENRCIADDYCAANIDSEKTMQTATILGALGSIKYRWIFTGLILLILIIWGNSYLFKKKK